MKWTRYEISGKQLQIQNQGTQLNLIRKEKFSLDGPSNLNESKAGDESFTRESF